MFLRIFLFVLLIGFGVPSYAADLSGLDLVNPRQPLETITTAGQPSIDDLEYFASEGYTLVINLRFPEEFDDFDEKAVVEGLGMKYINIPVRGISGMTAENAEMLHQAIEGATGPVLLHCTVGMRASVLLGFEGYLFHELSPAEAAALGKKAHLKHSGDAIKGKITKYEKN